MLYDRGIRLVPKARTQVCFPFVVSAERFEAIVQAIARYDMDPHMVAGKMLDLIAISPTKTRALVAEIAKDEGAEEVPAVAEAAK
jgi:hypothetical protein